jgi:hypothetical protein
MTFSALIVRSMHERRRKQATNIFEDYMFWAEALYKLDEMQKDIAAIIVQAKPTTCCRESLTRWATDNREQLLTLKV